MWYITGLIPFQPTAMYSKSTGLDSNDRVLTTIQSSAVFLQHTETRAIPPAEEWSG